MCSDLIGKSLRGGLVLVGVDPGGTPGTPGRAIGVVELAVERAAARLASVPAASDSPTRPMIRRGRPSCDDPGTRESRRTRRSGIEDALVSGLSGE